MWCEYIEQKQWIMHMQLKTNSLQTKEFEKNTLNFIGSWDFFFIYLEIVANYLYEISDVFLDFVIDSNTGARIDKLLIKRTWRNMQ